MADGSSKPIDHIKIGDTIDMVGIGQFISVGPGRVDDRGQERDQLTGTLASPIGHVILDHPHQVRTVRVDVLPVRAAAAELAVSLYADREDQHDGS